VEARPHRALRDREAVGDLLEPEVQVIVGDDDVAVVLGEGLERVADAGVPLAGFGAEVGVVARVLGRRKRGELDGATASA
jgi:hypothetical protein